MDGTSPKADVAYLNDAKQIFDEILNYSYNKKKWFKAFDVLQDIVLLLQDDITDPKLRVIFKT